MSVCSNLRVTVVELPLDEESSVESRNSIIPSRTDDATGVESSEGVTTAASTESSSLEPLHIIVEPPPQQQQWQEPQRQRQREPQQQQNHRHPQEKSIQRSVDDDLCCGTLTEAQSAAVDTFDNFAENMDDLVSFFFLKIGKVPSSVALQRHQPALAGIHPSKLLLYEEEESPFREDSWLLDYLRCYHGHHLDNDDDDELLSDRDNSNADAVDCGMQQSSTTTSTLLPSPTWGDNSLFSSASNTETGQGNNNNNKERSHRLETSSSFSSDILNQSWGDFSFLSLDKAVESALPPQLWNKMVEERDKGANDDNLSNLFVMQLVPKIASAASFEDTMNGGGYRIAPQLPEEETKSAYDDSDIRIINIPTAKQPFDEGDASSILTDELDHSQDEPKKRARRNSSSSKSSSRGLSSKAQNLMKRRNSNSSKSSSRDSSSSVNFRKIISMPTIGEKQPFDGDCTYGGSNSLLTNSERVVKIVGLEGTETTPTARRLSLSKKVGGSLRKFMPLRARKISKYTGHDAVTGEFTMVQ